MEISDIVLKLIGPVAACGSHSVDLGRLENLKQLTEVVDSLLLEIAMAAQTADHSADSMRRIGEYAKGFLDNMFEDSEAAQVKEADDAI